MNLNELNRRFSDRPAHTPETLHVAGTALAIAQDWLIRLPPGEQKTLALHHLDAAAAAACAAYARPPTSEATR